MRCLTVLLAQFSMLVLSGCVTTGLSSIESHEESGAFLSSLRALPCDPAAAHVFRASFFADEKLVMLADVELVPPGMAGHDDSLPASGRMVLRGESLEELASIPVGRDLATTHGIRLDLAGRTVIAERSSVTIEGRRFPMGPGEVACLMAGTFPAHWLSARGWRWNSAGGALELDEGVRRIIVARGGGMTRITVKWSSSWFSKSAIRVTMTPASAATLGVSGSIEAPHGYSLKWTEL